MAKKGRTAFVVTDDVIENVKILSGRGLTQMQIHEWYGIGHTAWYAAIKKNPALKAALRTGKARAISLAVGKLFEQVLRGNVRAIEFYLKTQGRESGFGDYIVTENIDGGSKTSSTELPLHVTDPIEAARVYQQVMTGSDDE